MMCKFYEKEKDFGRGSHVANEGERKEFNFTGIDEIFKSIHWLGLPWQRPNYEAKKLHQKVITNWNLIFQEFANFFLFFVAFWSHKLDEREKVCQIKNELSKCLKFFKSISPAWNLGNSSIPHNWHSIPPGNISFQFDYKEWKFE